MTTNNNTLTRFWVNQSQTAAIRLGDFTPAELRAIAAEIEQLNPPVQSQAEEATPPAGGWVYRLLWCNVLKNNTHCAVNDAMRLVVPFADCKECAVATVERFNKGTSKSSDYRSFNATQYEEAHV